jgi:acyl phosphate:glycerol-3-phosphate acyltransferase
MVWGRYAGALILAYLLGAVPVGWVLVKLVKNLDIRRIGSGRTGGTNVLRVAGAIPALLTVLGDFFKGYGAVALARMLVPDQPPVAALLIIALAGLAAVAGHNFSVFLGFAGGAGTMTTLGAAVALAPVPALVIGVVGLLIVAIWRYSSLGSLTIAVLMALGCILGAALALIPAAYLPFALGTSALSIWALRPNIARLRQGTERKVGQPAQPSASGNTSPSK